MVPILVNDRVISPFREDFIFLKLRIAYAKFRENKTLENVSHEACTANTMILKMIYDIKCQVDIL